MDTLRFITCGSVDDGKSTLIGRLLYETKLIFEDQLEALKADSKNSALRASVSILLCSSTACRRNASRRSRSMLPIAFFATPRRRFIVADTPGHEQYTRNMATGASTAQAAVLLDRRAQGCADPDKTA